MQACCEKAFNRDQNGWAKPGAVAAAGCSPPPCSCSAWPSQLRLPLAAGAERMVVVESHQQETTLISAAQLPPPVGPGSSAVSVELSAAAACGHPRAPRCYVAIPFLGMFNQCSVTAPFSFCCETKGRCKGHITYGGEQLPPAHLDRK